MGMGVGIGKAKKEERGGRMSKISIELKREEWELITKALRFDSNLSDELRLKVHYLGLRIEKTIRQIDGELIDIADEDMPF